MNQIIQKNRSISISDFSLGEETQEEDILLLTSFSGSEYISNCFQFRLEVLSKILNLTSEKIVGKKVTITFNKTKRYFHGYISQIEFEDIVMIADGNEEKKAQRISLTMVPWLWFLSKTNNHRVFQNINTKDIITMIFSDYGYSDFEFSKNMVGGHKREYCIQHNESDFHFISRLLEEDGIPYFFKHDQDKHTLVFVDTTNTYQECSKSDLIYYKGSNLKSAHIYSWSHQYNFKAGVWTVNDYNFKDPDKDQLGPELGKNAFANQEKFEHYEYPDIYVVGDSGDEIPRDAATSVASIRLAAEKVGENTVNVVSNCDSLYAGGKFTLAEHPSDSENGCYIITGIRHQATEDSYFQGRQGSDYSNSFTCIPDTVYFRPIQQHARPIMLGPQSAIVVGRANEENDIDEFGRIKVQFMWDRVGKKNENSSCFIRVVQSMAGNGWGTSFIPRIGHEVIVNFLDGDPDRPIITGSVYNGKNKPVYSSKTQSGIRTRSSKEGTAANFNELRFDDKKGSEQVFMQAEKNFDTNIKHDETSTIGNNQTHNIKENKIVNVGASDTEKITGSKTIGVGGNYVENITGNKKVTITQSSTENITGDKKVTIAGSKTTDVVGNYVENVTKNKDVSVTGDYKQQVTKNKTITVTKKHKETIKKNMIISVGGDLKETVTGKYSEGVKKEYALTAKTILLEAKKKIIIKTGDSSITMDDKGIIKIEGKEIYLGTGKTKKLIGKGKKCTFN